jgi:hypothetical protein
VGAESSAVADTTTTRRIVTAKSLPISYAAQDDKLAAPGQRTARRRQALARWMTKPAEHPLCAESAQLADDRSGAWRSPPARPSTRAAPPASGQRMISPRPGAGACPPSRDLLRADRQRPAGRRTSQESRSGRDTGARIVQVTQTRTKSRGRPQAPDVCTSLRHRLAPSRQPARRPAR